MKILNKLIICLAVICCCAGCDNSGDILDDFIKQGPIIYAAKVDALVCQTGLYRLRVNIYSGEDVNRDYCLLNWNITAEQQDSVKIYYKGENFDRELNCYYTILNLKENDIQGNLEIRAQNVDAYGNRSLIYSAGAYVYGSIYLSTLTNDAVFVAEDGKSIHIDRKLGSVGNYISYEKDDGSFTEEVFVTEDTYLIENGKPGGIVRTKTKFLMDKSDIDELTPNKYLETKMPL